MSAKSHPKATDERPRLVTIQEAARYLSVSVSTLCGWVWQRKIPFVKMGRALRFDQEDLEQFVRSHRAEARMSPMTYRRGTRF